MTIESSNMLAFVPETLSAGLDATFGREAAGPSARARSQGAAPPRHFLMVSAPFGPFAGELARLLRSQGALCSRVILNGGDALDWGARNAFAFGGGRDDLGPWLQAVIPREQVTDIITYGDSSGHAATAIAVASDLGLPAHVLEQGYFRPDWITVERGGVNANSSLPRDPDWYLAAAATASRRNDQVVGRAMAAGVLWLFRYHLAMYLCAPAFSRFRTGYTRSAALQAGGHVVRYLFRGVLVHGHAQRRTRLMRAPGPLFLALLQRPGDSQLWRHSQYKDTAAFLQAVVASFAANAPTDANLMVRPHPLDPGLEPHEQTLQRIASREGVAGRVTFVDDGKLHEILPAIAGAVCVNSTAGLAAIEFGRPTIVLGKAIYDMPGLTHQGGLERFWTEPEAPSAELYGAFRQVALDITQVNGAFATRRGRALAIPAVAGRLMASRPLKCRSGGGDKVCEA
jgi:capsular polysaccharide export protein